MKEEIKRILKMVEEGKITSDQASDLIDALKENQSNQEQPKSSEKNLKVNIISHKGKNVNVKFPLKFVKGIIKATGKMPVHINGSEEIDMKAFAEAIENEVTGKIVEINTKEGDYIEVVIE